MPLTVIEGIRKSTAQFSARIEPQSQLTPRDIDTRQPPPVEKVRVWIIPQPFRELVVVLMDRKVVSSEKFGTDNGRLNGASKMGTSRTPEQRAAWLAAMQAELHTTFREEDGKLLYMSEGKWRPVSLKAQGLGREEEEHGHKE